jgi:hypothetical protein
MFITYLIMFVIIFIVYFIKYKSSLVANKWIKKSWKANIIGLFLWRKLWYENISRKKKYRSILVSK